jgi:hypothetical protein
MFRNSTNTASFFSVLMVELIFSLSLAGVAPAQTNTSLGTNALVSNTTGDNNIAYGPFALFNNANGRQQHRNRTQCAPSQHDGLQQLRHRV